MTKTTRQLVRKILLLSLCAIMVLGGFTACDRAGSEIKIDPNRTQLYVYNYDGGVGSEWLDPLITRFEEAYKNESFEEGKTGVQVIPKKTKSGFENLLQTSNDAVFFAQQVYYNQLQSQNRLYPITDIVREIIEEDGKKNAQGEVDENGEYWTIEDKLTTEQKKALTAYDGEYYALPHYVLFSCLTYDKDMFENEKLYINRAGRVATNYATHNRSDVSESFKLSFGPDGVENTYDDGLPSTIKEFELLCQKLKEKEIKPFIFSGQYTAYSTNILNAMWASLTGAEEFYYNFSFDSGTNTTEIVTSFTGDTPNFEKVQITPQTAYKLKAQSGKYYALEFFEKAIDSGWFSDLSYNGSTSHTDAHRNFVNSYPDNTKEDIGMLLEGSYWYHEAKDVINDAKIKFPHMGERNFAVMPLPTRYDDSTPCKKNTIVDANSSFAFISQRIANNPVALRLAKLFLKFCYTDKSLQEFTTTTGTAKGLKYSLTDAQYNSLPTYFKSVYDISSQSDIVYPYSDSKIFVNNQKGFGIAQDTILWQSGVYGIPLGAMKDSNYSAKKYFEPWVDFETQESLWNSSYSRYFD